MTILSHLIKQLPMGASFSNSQLIPQLLCSQTGLETQIHIALRRQPRVKVSEKALNMKAFAARKKITFWHMIVLRALFKKKKDKIKKCTNKKAEKEQE